MISILVPSKTNLIYRLLEHTVSLDIEEDYEIIVCTPNKINFNHPKVKIIPDPEGTYGSIKPVNECLRYSQGEYFVSIPDDLLIHPNCFKIKKFIESETFENRKVKMCSTGYPDRHTVGIPNYKLALKYYDLYNEWPRDHPVFNDPSRNGNIKILSFPSGKKESVVTHLDGLLFNESFRHAAADNYLSFYLSHEFNEDPVFMPNTEYVIDKDQRLVDKYGSREYDCMMYYTLVHHYVNMASQKKHVPYSELLNIDDQKSNPQKEEGVKMAEQILSLNSNIPNLQTKPSIIRQTSTSPATTVLNQSCSGPPKLSIISAVKGRVELTVKAFNSIWENALDPLSIEHLIVSDCKDMELKKKLVEYRDFYQGSDINIVLAEVCHCKNPDSYKYRNMHRDYWNPIANMSTGDLVFGMPNDCIIKTEGFDKILFESFEDAKQKYGHDCFQILIDDDKNKLLEHAKKNPSNKDDICSWIILSRTAVNVIGGICPNEFQRATADNHIFSVFSSTPIKSQIDLRDKIKTEHTSHYTGRVPVDDVTNDQPVLTLQHIVEQRVVEETLPYHSRINYEIARQVYNIEWKNIEEETASPPELVDMTNKVSSSEFVDIRSKLSVTKNIEEFNKTISNSLAENPEPLQQSEVRDWNIEEGVSL